MVTQGPASWGHPGGVFAQGGRESGSTWEELTAKLRLDDWEETGREGTLAEDTAGAEPQGSAWGV